MVKLTIKKKIKIIQIFFKKIKINRYYLAANIDYTLGSYN